VHIQALDQRGEFVPVKEEPGGFLQAAGQRVDRRVVHHLPAAAGRAARSFSGRSSSSSSPRAC
jgi:hypothetical protein